MEKYLKVKLINLMVVDDVIIGHSIQKTVLKICYKQLTVNMTGPPQNLLMFCITIEHKSSCNTKIFCSTCKRSF